MGRFTGQVLRGTNTSPTNALTTAEATTGVLRDVIPVPSSYSLLPPQQAPEFVDARADQYRAAVLLAPGTTTQEYLVWAENTSSLTIIDDPGDPAWQSDQGIGVFQPGSLPVLDDSLNSYDDGADHFVVTDEGGRSIGTIVSVNIARGDRDYENTPYINFTISSSDQNPVSGVVNLTAAQLVVLDGGLSGNRGDQIMSVHYTVAPAKCWWTRNDRYETRFGWNGKNQRWEPYKGSTPKDLGSLLEDVTYRMSPKVINLPIGSILPGTESQSDEYSMIRLGSDPGVTSLPVGPGGAFVGIQVKPDRDVASFDFTASMTLSGIMGQTSGELRFNPDFAANHLGKTIWYIPKIFTDSETGIVGELLTAVTQPIFICPIPGPLDCPLLRLGNRHYLSATTYINDAALNSAPAPVEGAVQVSLSTGRLRLSQADIDKSDPAKPTSFSKHFLGEDVIYDGVALNAIPEPTQKPVQLVDAAGNLATGNSTSFYIPDAITLPDEFTSLTNEYRGLGVSGVLDAPDGTGALPAQPLLPASVRPGGDSSASDNVGRIRQVDDKIGDVILFSSKSAVSEVHIVDRETDLPRNASRGEAWVALERGLQGSKVIFNREDLSDIGASGVFFLQATFLPAMFTRVARILSRNRDVFRFTGDEILYFAVDGMPYQWASSTLLTALPNNTFFTPAEVAASIDLLSPGISYDLSGRVVIEANDPDTGTVEIGFGDSDKDLSGAAALGFIPGWKVKGGYGNWLPDSGIGVGMFRSPVNLDRSLGLPDICSTSRVTDGVVQSSIQPSPFVFLDNPPLQDVAGYDDGVFFSLTSLVDDGEGNITPVIKPLENFQDIIYRFGQGKFDWITEGTSDEEFLQPVSVIQFPNQNVVPESLLGAPGIGGGLYVSPDGGASIFQTQDSDYIFPEDGSPGTALLTHRYGSRVMYGANGRTYTTGEFSDSSSDFSGIQAGYRVKVTSGSSAGSYIVTGIVSPTTLSVIPAPLFTTPSNTPITWELFEGYTESVYDPALVADMFYEEFSHLPSEPFKVRMLSPVGIIPTVPGGTRLKANMAGALASSRIINLRYGLVAPMVSNTATLVGLTNTYLGIIANGSLSVPIVDPRFSTGSFSIQIGSEVFTQAGNLVGVANFTVPVPAGTVEYLTADTLDFPKGSLKFATDLLTDFAMARVVYLEDFLPAANMAPLTVEYDGPTGELNFSQDDMTLWGGSEAYFVEQMVTENREDVSLSPLIGSFAFTTPVPQGSSVEAEYYKADLEGRVIGDLITEAGKITEFLPVFVHNEIATRVSEHIYTFNPNGLTPDQTVDPIIYTGAIMKNFGQRDCVVSYPIGLNGLGQITFLNDLVTIDTVVKISYGVFESLGGERAYETSQKPVYRPPFYIKANQSRFGLRGDRSADFVPGQMLRFGEDCFYIKSTVFYPTSANGPVTGVNIFPSTLDEVGTRSPANDILSLVTSRPITTEVDPDGVAPVATTAPAGFMQPLDLTLFPFEPVSRGQSTITFAGNLTQFAVAGHIFEIGGYPHNVSQANLSDDGTRTSITVSAPFRAGFSMDHPPTIKLSYRPVYPPQTRDLIGVGPLVDTEDYELVLFGQREDGVEVPGKTLVPGVEYSIDPGTGTIQLLGPAQDAVGGDQKLILSFTQLRVLQPIIHNGIIITPRVTESYLYVSTPTSQNGLLGGLLTGTYTFRNPDAFYFRAVPMGTFLGEMAQEAILEITSKQPAGGPIQPTQATQNWQQGRIGLKSQRGHLVDKDRAARTFLDFYNRTILAFEQIEETISGGFIGDRDGKFRFWMGTGRDYPTPGYEDAITGILTSRFVWGDAFNGLTGTSNFVTVLPGDWVVSPSSFSLSAGVVDGQIPNPSLMAHLLDEQWNMVSNDIDDLIAVNLGKPKATRTAIYPFYHIKTKAHVARMVDQHRFSRLFPTVTKAFFMTFPGIDSVDELTPGFYSAGRYTSSGNYEKTRGESIGQLYNPVIGDIDNVRTAKLSKRRARARIWGYFPQGIPAGAFDGGASPVILYPCIVGAPALLRDVLIDPVSGYPDEDQFISQSPTGTLPDLEAGDPDLMVPGFHTGDEIEWGKPDGTTYRALCPLGVDMFGTNSFTGLFVEQILYGCVLILRDGLGNIITSPFQVLVGTGAAAGTPAHLFPIEQGDTIYAGPLIGTTSEPSDPPSRTTLQTMASNMDSYRNGFDLEVNSDGSIEDKSYPSENDPTYLPIKEILGQNTPDPLSQLEGPVSFIYSSENPLEFPALKGELTDDSGDYQIPYIRTSNTELDRFGEIFPGMTNFMNWDNILANAVYPDELVSSDCDVDGTTNTLHIPLDIVPAPAPGVGPVAPYDLMLVQVEAPGPFTAGVPALPTVGPMGIFSVAKHSTVGTDSYVEVPRFVTQTTPPVAGSSITGSPVRYTFNNALSYIDTNPAYPYGGLPQPIAPPGMEIIETLADSSTYLCFNSIGAISLNNGVNPGTGNLNDILAASVDNIVCIHVYSRWDDTVTAGIPAGLFPPLWPVINPPGGGREILTIWLKSGFARVDTYQAIGAWQICATPPVFGTSANAPFVDPSERHIKIPLWGIMPWGPGWVPPLLPENEWVIPHIVTDLGGPNETRATLYGYEFAIDVITEEGLGTGHSDTAWISDDRLTFNEIIDMRLAKPRGTYHPRSGASMEANLTIWGVTVGNTPGTSFMSYVNTPCNGMVGGVTPIPFTFPAPAGGTWTPLVGPVTERGTIKVCGYEGWDNTPVFGTGITASLLPSNERDEVGKILLAVGKTASKYSASLPPIDTYRWDDRIADLTVVSGDVDRVVPGDIVTIESSNNAAHLASTMVGTYLVRHAVESTPGYPFRKTHPQSVAGSGNGWCPVHFPSVVSYDILTHTLTLSDLAPAPQGILVGGNPCGFLATGRLYIMINVSNLASPVEDTFKSAVMSCAYTLISTNVNLEGLFTINPVAATFLDASGGALSVVDSTGATLVGEAAFNYLLSAGMQVSGMVYWPVAIGGEQGLPENNCVGYHTDADGAPPVCGRAVYGFRWFSLSPPDQLLEDDTVQNQVYSGNLADPLKIDTATAVDTVVPMVGTPLRAYQMLNPTDVVYDWVPDTLDIRGIQAVTWALVNIPPSSWGTAPGTSAVSCLLPFSTVALENLANPAPVAPDDVEGFYAQGGIFLEPSFPRMATNMTSVYSHVVDASHPLPDPLGADDWDREIGSRDSDAYAVLPHPPGTGVPEEVIFSVKRIRRFHGAEIAQDLKPLWYAYEIRRGIITNYTPDATRQVGTVEALGFYMNWVVPPLAPKPADVWEDGTGPHVGTNLGTFDDHDVNIHAGDSFRLLDDDGTLLEEVQIASVLNSREILLAVPGITKVVNPNGYRFEIYLKRAPVPHEQSNEQLLDMISDHEVYRTNCDWATEKGGYVQDTGADVYANVVNKLYDDLRAPSMAVPFSALGVRKGDIIIVDPAGTIPQSGGLPSFQEKGSRPLGDQGVIERTVPGVYVPGLPTPLDDNRGYYRVIKVNDTVSPPYLDVDPISTYAGSISSPVVFAPANVDRAYAIYPTIHDSAISASGDEGQMDLRPTAVRDPVTKEFDNRAGNLRFHSIRPFSYRVIRPTSLFSDEAIDLVLMHRERILSFIEMIRRLLMGDKTGTYYIFQLNEQIDELGDPRDPDIGLGVLSNAYLLASIGRTNVVPFANNGYALSLLDRRFWIHDTRLDSLTTDPTNPFNMIIGVPAYTAYLSDPDGIDVNPLLPERVEQVLDTRDQFRQMRYVWLAYRTHKTLGTLTALTRFDAELPKRLAEQLRTQLQLNSMSKV